MTAAVEERQIGIQTPNILCEPNNSIGSYGPEAIQMAENVGLHLDPWQKMSLTNILSIKDDEYYNKYTKQLEFKWAARTCGIVVSRQNGKGSILEARQLAGLFITGDKLIIHSAHEHDTAQEAHVRLLDLIAQDPELKKQVLRTPMGHGEQGVELRNGQRMRFRTRTKGGGRGFTADLVILDEAMILEDAFVGALMPTLSARPNPQLIYTGSAGDKNSTAFGRIRRNAIRHALGMFFAEWSINPCTPFCRVGCTKHDDPRDVHSWLKANPAYGIRDLGYDDVVAEMEAMSIEQFQRERLGVGTWPTDADGWITIPKPNWMIRQDENSFIEGSFAVSVDTDSDMKMSSIAAAGNNEAGDTHVEVTASETDYDSRPGVQWVVPRLAEIKRNSGGAFKVLVIDKTTNAGAFITEIESHPDLKDILMINPNSREHSQACGMFSNGIVPQDGEVAFITHIEDVTDKNNSVLSKAVAALDTKKLSDGITWDRVNSGADITPANAATNAVWGFRKFIYSKPRVKPWVYRG